MSRQSRRVVAVAYDGLCTFEFGIAAEVFGQPQPGRDWYEFRVAAAEAGPLRAHGGLLVAADGGLELFGGAGTIIVPGWRGPSFAPPAPLLVALRGAHAAGSRIVSICGGAFVLAAAGLLAGRRATTHWRHAAPFAAAFPDVRLDPGILYTDEDDILTSAGSAAGIDLCLHIVRRDHGPEVANAVARGLVVPPHRDGDQAQYVARPLAQHTGAPLGPMLDWMRSAIAEALPLARLSARAAMSQRTFLRRFAEATGTTPADWLLTERLALACDLLESGRLGIEDIALRCGFGAAATLRHHFTRRLHTTPTAYRHRFSRATPALTDAA